MWMFHDVPMFGSYFSLDRHLQQIFSLIADLREASLISTDLPEGHEKDTEIGTRQGNCG
jgi:hypothetical protein